MGWRLDGKYAGIFSIKCNRAINACHHSVMLNPSTRIKRNESENEKLIAANVKVYILGAIQKFLGKFEDPVRNWVCAHIDMNWMNSSIFNCRDFSSKLEFNINEIFSLLLLFLFDFPSQFAISFIKCVCVCVKIIAFTRFKKKKTQPNKKEKRQFLIRKGFKT